MTSNSNSNSGGPQQGSPRPQRQGWADEAAQRHYTDMADRLTHVSTRVGDGFLVDLWTPDPRGQHHHGQDLNAVVTVRPGADRDAVLLRLPEWSALAWDVEPDPDPRARLMEALLQGHLRAQERMTT